MYKITRKSRIVEALALDDSCGNELVLNVDLTVDDIAKHYNKARETLGMAQNELLKSKSEMSMEAFGKALFSYLDIIFGEEQRTKLVEFYENRYTELLLDIFPFINDVINPKIREASKQRAEQLKAAASMAKGKSHGKYLR